MAVYGTKGTLVATTPGLPQISPITLIGAQGDEPLAPLPVPERLRLATSAVPDGPARNVAQAYARIADAIREGRRFDPDFDHATRLHELLEALRRSSEEGRAVELA